MVGDRGLAEDLAQETFVKAFRNLAAFDTTRRLSSWLFRIAHNTALDSLRRARATAPLTNPAHEAWEPAAAAEPDPIERHALADALERAMARLRPEYRAAVTLRYDEALSFDEIGHVMGIPEATARSHVHRARKELARRLEAAGWRPDR